MQNYVSALLSNISYLKEGNYSINAAGKLTLFGGSESELTAAEIAFFNEHFTIEHQKNGTEGFSAMTIVAVKTSVFGGFNAGDVTVAYRGTELELDDFITDIGMAIKALDDIIPDIIVDALSVIPLIRNLRAIGNLPIWGNYFNSQTQQALNYFNDVKSAYSNLNVVGHSLGGFLANYVTVRDNNYQYINNTTTFNAPGFSIAVHSIKKVEATLENLILQDKSHLTTAEIDELNYEINILQEKIKIDQFNENSFNKLNPYFSSTGIEFTSNDLIMFSPVEKIPLFTTPQDIPIFDHKIALLMESTALYDSLNAIMKGVLVDNYKTITNMLENFHKLPLTTTTIKQITKYISTFLGFSSESSFDVFNFVSNLTSSELNNYIYKPINSSNYKDSSANLYALFNFIPFSISNSNDIFNDTDFNVNKYTEQKLSEKYDLFEKYNNLSKFTLSHATLKNMSIYETYKIIYEENSSSAYVIFDERNKIIITNDSRSAASSSGIGDFSFYGDSFANIETTYLKNNQSALFVNTLKNKVYDTYLDDYIHLNKGSTTLDLSYGSDTVSIDVAAGATIKDLTIKDGGVGDLFIFNGGTGADFIQGTNYKDKIIGGDGDDALFGGDGNDVIDGGLGNDMIFGENGDDTLIGGDGDDMLMGFGGSNSLNGGDGDDMLNAYNTPGEYHDIRGDILSGGTGFNRLLGTGYGDTYIYGNGVDTIHESDKNFGLNYTDKLIFRSDTQASEVSLYNILNNLVIAINGINKIYVIDYYNNNYSYLDEIHFSNIITGEPLIWNTNYILQNTINKNDGSVGEIKNGSSRNDNITGTSNADYIDAGIGNDIINGGNGDDTIHGDDGDDKIDGSNGNDKLYGGNGDDTIYGGDGNDTIYGGNGSDKIYSGNGFDIIYGDSGDDFIGSFEESLNNGFQNDTMTGGLGSDTIYLSRGSSIIHYKLGDGNDIILLGNDDVNDIDKIFFGSGITSSNTSVKLINNNDVLLSFIDGGTLLLKNYANQSNFNKIDFFNFSDGVVWTSDDIIARFRVLEGTGGDDYLHDTLWNDTINAHGGKDTIYSGSGSDIINAGGGDDYIYIDFGSIGSVVTGGSGDDEYWIDGNNTTLIMSGSNNGVDYISTPNLKGVVNVRINANMNDIYLANIKSISNTGTFYWSSDSGMRISLYSIRVSHEYNFIFNDGQTQSLTDIVNKLEGDDGNNRLFLYDEFKHITSIYGKGGNDLLISNADATYLDGGDGDDRLLSTSYFNVTMQGGSGNDTFEVVFGAKINDTSGYDKVNLSLSGSASYNSINLSDSGNSYIVTNKVDGMSISFSKSIEELILSDYSNNTRARLAGNEINQVIELMAQYESDELADMGTSDDPEIIKSYNEIRKQISININNLWGV